MSTIVSVIGIITGTVATIVSLLTLPKMKLEKQKLRLEIEKLKREQTKETQPPLPPRKHREN